MRYLRGRHVAVCMIAFAALISGGVQRGLGAEEIAPFAAEATQWRDGFARYDYLMDLQTKAIAPFAAPSSEHFAVGASPKGFCRCVVVLPKQAAAGNPWSWRGCYWDHQPQAEVQLLHRGFAIAFVAADPDSTWDAWYAFLTQHGLSQKPAFVGMSKGGVNAYDWATTHPDAVSCIYADNPAIRPAAFDKLSVLAAHDIPLLNVVGSEDYLLQHHTLPIENRYEQLGGRFTLIMKLGTAHHPHSLQDPTLIVDWMEKNSRPNSDNLAFGDAHFVKSYYYSLQNTYRLLPADGVYAVCRGPGFTPCYDRYDVPAPGAWGLTGTSIIVPTAPASAKPWVLRANAIDRGASVDQLLLAKGFTIVTAPLIEQIGPTRSQWDAVYRQMVSQGYSSRPLLEGSAAGAGEAIAWAAENTDKVAAIYVERPILRSLMSKTPTVGALSATAKANVQLIISTSAQDPWRADAQKAQSIYQQQHVQVEMIAVGGTGQDPISTADAERVVVSLLAGNSSTPLSKSR